MRRLIVSVLLALACATLIGAAAPVAGALSRDAQVKQNVRLLKTYIDGYAAGRSYVFPAASVVKKGGGLTAPVWPVNPWTGKPMAPGSGRGAFTYTPGTGGTSYTLAGHLSSGGFTLTGGTPNWLTEERSAAAASLSDAHAATAFAQAEAAAAEADATAAGQARDEAIQQRDAAVQQREAAEAQLTSTQAELTSTQTELAATKGSLDEKTAQLATTAAQLTTTEAQLTTTAAQLTATQGQLTSAQADLASSQTALAAKTAELTTAKADLATSQAALSTAQTSLTTARNSMTELGARVIKGYVEQWGMLYNATSPASGDVGKTGAVGAMFSFWPDNPFTGQPMAADSATGDFTYTQGADGTSYLLSAHKSATSVSLDGTVPQQLKNALDNVRSQATDENIRVIQAAIDRYAMDYNDTFPAAGQVSAAWLAAYVDLWPKNPWTNVAMIDGSGQGNYTYSRTQNGYTLTSHLKGGLNGDTVDNYYADHYLGVRDHLKNVYCQAAVQVLKEYVEEWKAANSGALPTVDQLTKTGAIGSVHAWWPVDPWYGSPMTNDDVKGDFQYTPVEDGSYALTVRQQPDAYYLQYYPAH